MSRSWRAAPRLIHTATPSGGVVLDPAVKRYFTLNATGEALWGALVNGASRDQMIELLCRAFDVDSATAEHDVDRWIEELHSARLIDDSTG